jgi:hypothetical protein
MLMHGVDLRYSRVTHVIGDEKIANGDSPSERVAAYEEIKASSICDTLPFYSRVNDEQFSGWELLDKDSFDLIEERRSSFQSGP